MANFNHESRRPAKALSLADFAIAHGITYKNALKYCRTGRLFGAHKNPLTKKWMVFPPAKILSP